ncbi:hypothetical protein PG985_005719 [Apiospora marii]|uniref:uncharacterized protein n=1 Tax=Apiospora marii TaxID=335849 RepID=UPI0031311B60
MDGATVGVGPVSRAKILGIGPRLMLTRLGTDIDAAELLSIGFGLWEDSSNTGWSDWTNREIGVNHSLSKFMVRGSETTVDFWDNKRQLMGAYGEGML